MKKVYTVFETDWGFVAAIWTERGLWQNGFPRRDKEQALADITIVEGIQKAREELFVDPVTNEIRRYFDGGKVQFDLPIDWTGYTQFQAAVLAHTYRIPYGEVTTYGQLAAAVGSPGAARAVGGALHINRTPIVIPCHRVLGKGGSLTGFGGGIEVKRALLEWEEKEPERNK
ncbi:MAG: ogt 2 [Firmicutes bacterium]|nr:ogt 2 [Bacillota bacterium]